MHFIANKKKIINDPVHGFIHLHNDFLFDLIQHPIVQRLRRIRQLGLAELVYPGAVHTRFHHALGALHLMGQALDTLRLKGVDISEEEYEATQAAILLHDLGHGPMSHALEYTLLKNIPHEAISHLLMEELNQYFSGRLQLAIDIFTGEYPRLFLHQLVSSQLDMDRLDYLKRDSFFTGVSEGTIGSDRLIKMLAVYQNELVIEEKGIYSVENFLTARRLMYWQVYLHKTNISVEQMLIQVLKRARKLVSRGVDLTASPALHTLLREKISLEAFSKNPDYLNAFTALDDYDIWAALKAWRHHSDKVLAIISRSLLDRQLFKVVLSAEKPKKSTYKQLQEEVKANLDLSESEVKYCVTKGISTNEAYLGRSLPIKILRKKGEIMDIAQASDLPNIKALRKIVKKYYLCWAISH